ncbi:MAG TPA: hypothetical protein VGG46_00880 [Terriglobales bacterium]|jgi:hypothetical protein
MKWVLFFFSVISLFFAGNTLFFVPEQYDLFTIVAAGVAIAIAGICAWFSSKAFALPARSSDIKPKNIVMAPPAVVWIVAILLFCFFGLMKFRAYH